MVAEDKDEKSFAREFANGKPALISSGNRTHVENLTGNSYKNSSTIGSSVES